MEQEMNLLLKEIEQILRNEPLDWEQLHQPPNTESYWAKNNDWHFLIVDFSIEDQGFPSGSRGQDGIATNGKRGIVMHLTRDLAALGFEKAKEQNDILIDHAGAPDLNTARRLADFIGYQDFKFDVISKLPKDEWTMTSDEVDRWLKERKQ